MHRGGVGGRAAVGRVRMKALAIRRRARGAVLAWPASLHPLLARVYASRGLVPESLARSSLAALHAPDLAAGLDSACVLLADAIARDLRICVVGDFDADGATGTPVAVRGLRMLGARRVDYRVPNRAREGYGLSVALVESLLGAQAPDLILTVDNGIASLAGVAAAKARGITVVVTDHHLPGAHLPAADAIVNPQLVHGSGLRHLAGVGVMFYLLLALRAVLRARGRLAGQAREPDLSALLDLVALGTVADLVPLDDNNRILVAAGLRRIRAGKACAGIAALYRAARRDPARAVAADLGYVLGPRVNAAGRLEDMGVGIQCPLEEETGRADALAATLSQINAQRQDLQAAMVEQAQAMVASFLARHGDARLPLGVVLHEQGWHPGVVGLVASKLKECLHRPVIAFAPADSDARELRGSARSIAGFHLRDALATIDARNPGLILRFGGHAMAAGLSLPCGHLERFAAQFDLVAQSGIDAQALEHFAWSDGALEAGDFSFAAAHALRYGGPWGQGFDEPVFDNEFEVESSRTLGERHLKLRLRPACGGQALDAIAFGAASATPAPARIHALFQLDLNEWNGREGLQLLVKQFTPA